MGLHELGQHDFNACIEFLAMSNDPRRSMHFQHPADYVGGLSNACNTAVRVKIDAGKSYHSSENPVGAPKQFYCLEYTDGCRGVTAKVLGV
jgi:hypothetical protein